MVDLEFEWCKLPALAIALAGTALGHSWVGFFYEFDWLNWLRLWVPVLSQAELIITTMFTFGTFRKWCFLNWKDLKKFVIFVWYRMIFLICFFNLAVKHIMGHLLGLEKVGWFNNENCWACHPSFQLRSKLISKQDRRYSDPKARNG